jgi:hypothetical protein
MKNIIKPDLFKGMYSGELVNVARKNKKAIVIPKWKVPSYMVSQFFLNYSDDGGASKRTATFIFDRKVMDDMIDTDLERRIISNELPSIIYKAVKLYKEFLDSNDKRTFEYIRPVYFQNTIADYMKATNTVWQFLNQEPNTNKGVEYSVEFGDDLYTLWNDFEDKYKYWCKYKSINYTPIKVDDPTFRQMGLIKKRIKICKS